MIIPYKGKTTIASGMFYCPYIPLQIVIMTSKIKLNVKDIGDKRWVCYADVPRSMVRDFESWVQECLPNCWLNKGMWKYEQGTLKSRFQPYELRGTEVGDRTLLLLKWGNQ